MSHSLHQECEAESFSSQVHVRRVVKQLTVGLWTLIQRGLIFSASLAVGPYVDKMTSCVRNPLQPPIKSLSDSDLV